MLARCLLSLFILAAAPPAPPTPAPSDLPPQHAAWLEEVTVLMTPEERALFISLKKDYQRDAFIEQFWRQRDPYPDTGRNELRERWAERVQLARSTYRSLDDDRARVVLLNGAPGVWRRLRCRPLAGILEIWFYPAGSDRHRAPFLLVLFGREGRFRLWQPGDVVGLEELTDFDRSAGCTAEDSEVLNSALRWIRDQGTMEYVTIAEKVRSAPPPESKEWVTTFSSYSTDVDAATPSFDARLTLEFPGWYQNRTVAQGLVIVPTANISPSELAGQRSYNLMVTGEILEGGTLFDAFRYRFDFPAASVPSNGELPLLFQRYLRPGGPYALILKVEDLASGRVYRSERSLDVPRVEGREMPPPVDPRLAQVLAEANAALVAGETTVKLVPPIGDLLTGLVRFDTLVTGEQVKSVTFALNGDKILTKTRPPFSVELDLGDFPRTHVLSATAFDSTGAELASDDLLLNVAGSRFRVRLLEPVRNKRYTKSLRARAEVELPKGETLERVEIYLNDDRLATLYQEPFTQPIVLPQREGTPADAGGDLVYVRAVAYLTDGSSAEDLVFVNAPELGEEVTIQFVELYASVLDSRGRPVTDLAREVFKVEEDGTAQEIQRFEQVRDQPIHASILLDVSASMAPRMDAARQAALSFFEQAVRSRDRVSMITFNDRPYLAVPFTNDLGTFANGLAGLKAERGTALWDSVMYSLFYFTGISGQRALIVISDGKDESSRFDFERALDYARRAGIAVYTVSIVPEGAESGAKRGLSRLAEETGGRSFFLDSVDELEEAYRAIAEELRGQYLIAYQSKNTARGSAFRSIELKVNDRRGVEVKTLRGYYP